jgi:hypothetical protein
MCPIVELCSCPPFEERAIFSAKLSFLIQRVGKAASHLVNLLIFPQTLASETAAIDGKNVAFVFNRPYPGS